MIRIVGEISLYSALFFALLQSVLPILGFYRQNIYLLAFARVSCYAQVFFVLGAYTLMTIAFLTNDFSIAYVAANSHPTLPLMYQLTAVWGAHEGSILLWIVILGLWSIAFSVYANCYALPRPFSALAIAILGIISFSFLSFLIFTSNPFLPAITFQSGSDLNPLLQDPGFVIHPPMLYTGYVGFSVAFAITIAAILKGDLDATWANVTRRFAIVAWCFLTFGITLGSWWAYRVLGWGGFWFWDPVENASLLPWLSGTALIHVLLLCEKSNVAKNWAALLAIICFSLSLLGTFLVRSGVLISAHTFASDPTRGVFLLIMLGVLLTLTLLIYAIRLPKITVPKSFSFSLCSRENSLLLNSGLLIIAMLTVLLGTIYPLITDALKLGSISVGAPYFNFVMLPIVLIVMFFMGIAAFSRWKNQTLKDLWQRTSKKIIISMVLAAALLFYFTHSINITALLSLFLSFWIIFSVTDKTVPFSGMSIAHVGFAIFVIGVLLSSTLSEERQIRIKPGLSSPIGPYQFFFQDTEGIKGSNYRGIRANFEVIKGDRHITYLHPEKRIYTVRDMVMTKVDIHPGIFRDLYIALGEPLEGDDWSVRLYYKPFIRWIWLGGIIMILGGLFAILQRKTYSTGKNL